MNESFLKQFQQFWLDYMFLIGSGKSRLLLVLLLSFVMSLLEVIGVGMVGGYIALIAGVGYASEWIEKWSFGLLSTVSNRESIVILGALLVFIFLFKAAATLMTNYLIYRITNLFMLDLRLRTMRHYQIQPYMSHISRSAPEYIRTITGYVKQFIGALNAAIIFVNEAIIAIAIVIFLVVQSALSTSLLIIGFSGLSIFYYSVFRKKIKKNAVEANAAQKDLIASVTEGFLGFKEVRIFGAESFFLSIVARATKVEIKTGIFLALVRQVPRLFLQVGIVLAIVLFVYHSEFEDGNRAEIYPLLAMFGFGALRLMPSISQMLAAIVQIKNNSPARKELVSDLGKPTVSINLSESLNDRWKFLELDLIGVSLSYPNSTTSVLEDVSFRVESEEIIGIVGASGSGKTTLIDLMLGLLEPTLGQVVVNSRPLRDILNEWRNQIAYIPQDVLLIDDTIKANVGFGIQEKEIDEVRVRSVLDKVKLGEFVEGRPHGIHTRVGEMGIGLSGGQKQRIVLARALYRNRKVLILDEATSALDYDTEREILEELNQLKGSVTIVVITHRRSILAYCDRVYEVANKTVKEIGNYKDIAKSSDQS